MAQVVTHKSSLSQHRGKFDPRPVHVVFLVGMALGQVFFFSECFGIFSCQCYFTNPL